MQPSARRNETIAAPDCIDVTKSKASESVYSRSPLFCNGVLNHSKVHPINCTISFMCVSKALGDSLKPSGWPGCGPARSACSLAASTPQSCWSPQGRLSVCFSHETHETWCSALRDPRGQRRSWKPPAPQPWQPAKWRNYTHSAMVENGGYHAPLIIEISLVI